MPVLVLHVVYSVIKHLLHVPMLFSLVFKLKSEPQYDLVSQLDRILLRASAVQLLLLRCHCREHARQLLLLVGFGDSTGEP